MIDEGGQIATVVKKTILSWEQPRIILNCLRYAQDEIKATI